MAISRFSKPTREAFVPLPYEQYQKMFAEGEGQIRQQEDEMSELSEKLKNMKVLQGDIPFLQEEFGKHSKFVEDYDKKYRSYLDPEARRKWRQQVSAITNNKNLDAVSKSYAGMEQEEALKVKMIANGEIPIFGGGYKKHTTVNPETGQISIYQPHITPKLPY